MAARLLRAGHSVSVYNRSAGPLRDLVDAGAVHGKTPRAAAEGAEIIIAMVRDNEASRTVWYDGQDGAMKGLEPGAIAIESSTLTPTWVKELAAKVQQTGADFLDAPVVGSRPQADAGQLIHLVGGDADIFGRAKEKFSALGSAAHHVGPVGAGAMLKLAVNALFGIQVAALAELLALLKKSDCDPAAVTEALTSLPVTSPAAKGALALIQAKSDAPLFPVDLVEKDFAYVLDQPGAILPMTKTGHECFAEAKSKGLAALNITAIAQLYRAER
jgi:3-hydroxyisobutyrate dehydrogenase-like beta-hydroxyacid dehydrogenase